MSEFDSGLTARADETAGRAAPYKAPRSGLAWIAIGVIVAAALVIVGLRLVMSVNEVRFGRGEWRYIGTQAYDRFSADPAFSRAVASSLTVAFTRLIVCIALGMAGVALGRIGRIGKAAVIGFGIALAFTPTFVWDLLLAGINLDMAGNFAAGLSKRLLIGVTPWSGMALALGGAASAVWPKSFARAGFAPALLALVTFLTSGLEQALVSGSAMTASSSTIDELAYRYAFQNMQMAYASAAEVLRGAIALLPLAAGAVLLAVFMRRSPLKGAKPPVREGHVKAGLLCGLIAGGTALVLGLALLAMGSGAGELLRGAAGTPAAASAVLFFGELHMGAALYFGLLLCIGKLKEKSTFPFIVLALFLAPLAGTAAARYQIARSMGFLNTMVPVMMGTLFNPLSVTLLLCAALLRPRRVVTCLLLAIGLACLSAAFAVGNVTASNIYINDNRLVPLGAWLYRAAASGRLLSAASAEAGGYVYASFAGLLLTAVALPVGVGAGVLCSGALRE